MLTHLADADRPPSRVLVLGKSGFVARYLIPELQTKGIEAVALGRPELDLTSPSSVDVLSEAIRPDDAVVILSALTPDKGRDFRTFMSNLRMAEHLCETFDRRPCAQVLYVSSDAVYDGRTLPITESSTREPVDLYGLMHTSREMMLQSVLTARGIPCCIVRPSAIYGAGDTHNSYGPNRFIREAFDQKTITLFGQGEDLRAHLYVRDAIRLMMACLAKRSTGTLNIAPPAVMSFKQVAELLMAALPFPVELKLKMLQGGASTAPVSQRPFDVAALNQAFGEFAFTPVPAALAEYVAAFVE